MLQGVLPRACRKSIEGQAMGICWLRGTMPRRSLGYIFGSPVTSDKVCSPTPEGQQTVALLDQDTKKYQEMRGIPQTDMVLASYDYDIHSFVYFNLFHTIIPPRISYNIYVRKGSQRLGLCHTLHQLIHQLIASPRDVVPSEPSLSLQGEGVVISAAQ